jgi:hypothetical protein
VTRATRVLFATVATIVAGAVGGPIFWFRLGVLIWRRAGSLPPG